jgi:hypothetical protein
MGNKYFEINMKFCSDLEWLNRVIIGYERWVSSMTQTQDDRADNGAFQHRPLQASAHVKSKAIKMLECFFGSLEIEHEMFVARSHR